MYFDNLHWQQRSALLSELNLVTYPVLTLPPEITAEIFKWCIDTGTRMRLLPATAPLLFTRICRQWRALAFSTPALWDRMSHIKFGVHPRTETFIEMWFSRAGTRPLSLGITASRRSHPLELEVSAASLPSNRSQSFAISSLHVEPDEDEGHIQLFGVDGATPALRHLSLEGVLPSMLIMPWAQLTNLTLVLPHREEESPLEATSVNHSSLISLTIDTDDDQDILSLLTLPSLQKLELEGRLRRKISPGVGIVPFLSRVSGTLRTLNIGMASILPVQWLQPLTQLTTLELVRSVCLPLKTDIIPALDRRTSPDFLPKLQSLMLVNCGLEQVDNEMLAALDSRCDATDAAHAKLESFSLIWPMHECTRKGPTLRLPRANVLPLRVLARRGMRIHIWTRDQNSFC
ncbi:hypothetical protein B0H16DRAFT_1880913 [Mycena metata]|uniref:F-box domain-containing protein n=1 Tax=Mycena metata TaxID=1033252 RepID=A0AAD7NRH5_9AGAR|nr:hypothetical protein B0H16DRAFT_1880913 [Mycena metata]